MERKKFLSGYLCGIATTLCLGTVIIFGNRLGWFDWIYQTSTGSEKITNAERRQILSKLSLLEKYIDSYYLNDLSAEDYADGLYNGLISSLNDKYAAYYDEETYTSVSAANQGKYVGIGCSVSYDTETSLFTISSIVEDGPAAQSGIKSGDILFSVNGDNVTGMDLSEVVALMKGEEGTEVTIGVMRGSPAQSLEYVVEREEVQTVTVSYEMLDDQIGYIAISGFKDSTVEQFNAAMDDLTAQDMQGLILDVRNNGGGALSAVVSIADRLLPEGMIVYTKDKNGEGDEYYATDEEQFDLPMVLLVNENSASASEVLAGALKDHEAATLVGTTTYGKGIVQSIFSLSDGSAIKLTTSKYYTPNGYNIHEIGIDPDIEVEMDEEYDSLENPTKEDDNQLQTAIQCMDDKLEISAE